MQYGLTEKSKNLVTSKIFGGELYLLCGKNEEKELWIKAPPHPVLVSCIRCGYQGAALDKHHIHGRKNSDETIDLCANCHRELHAGEWEFKP